MNKHGVTGHDTVAPTPEVVWGAENIAELLGLKPWQVYYMADRGDLPIGKVRGKLFALRAHLIDHLERVAAGGLA